MATKPARKLIPVALACGAIIAALGTTAPAVAWEPSVFTGTVLDASTGEPAAGLEWVLYVRNGDTWAYESDGEVGATGRFTATSFPGKESVIYFVGTAAFEDLLYGGVRPQTPLVRPAADAFPRSVSPSVIVGAKRLMGGDSPRELGVTRVKPKSHAYGAVTGDVRILSTGGTAAGNAIVRSWVLDPVSGEYRPGPSTWTRASGAFDLIGSSGAPLLGKVLLLAEPQLYGLSDRIPLYFPAAEDTTTARSLDVRAGRAVQGVGCNVDLDYALTGTVVDGSSLVPQSDIKIQSYRQDAPNHWVSAMGTRTDRYGTFGMMAPTGTAELWLSAADDYRRYSRVMYFGQGRSLASAAGISLDPAGPVRGLDIYMTDRALLAGRVEAFDGRVLSDVFVQAYRLEMSGWRAVGSAVTNEDGRYSIALASGGTYTVRFVDRAGTSAAGDDSGVFLGGATTIESARRITVASGESGTTGVQAIEAVPAPRARRVAGRSGIENAVAASRETYAPGEADAVVLASGHTFADALSGSGLAGAVNGPLLLTDRWSVPREVFHEIDRLGVSKVYLLGGTAVLSTRVEGFLRAAGFEVERISGADRYATSARVAREIDSITPVDSTTPVFVTSGAVFADAVAAAPVAYSNDGVVLLTAPSGTPSSVRTVARELGVRRAYALGGSSSLPAAALGGFAASGVRVERVASGADRYDTASKFAAYAIARGWARPEHVGIVSGTGFVDALGASSAIGDSAGTLLLSARDGLPTPTARAVQARARRVKTIVVHGRQAAVANRALLQAGTY